jgi:putative membrane protein
MDMLPVGKAIVSSIIFSGIGLVMFMIAWRAINWLSPFSIHKELEQDHNTAVGIVLGSVMLGLAIIIAAAVHG